MNDARMRYIPLIPLALGSFLAIMTETMPVGMLPEISDSLNISQTLSGQLLTAYALGSFLSAVPIIAYTRTINRKSLLLLVLSGFCLANLAVAVTSSYYVLLAERFIAGIAAALLWGLLPGYTLRITPPSMQGRALAIMGLGQPLALSFGVPLTSRLVTYLSWHQLFIIIALIALMTVGLAAKVLPEINGEEQHQRKPASQVLTHAPLLVILAALFLWVTAHNVMYTYMAPYLSSLHLSDQLDIALVVFGISSIIAIMITSIYIDKYLKRITCICILLFISSTLILSLANNIAAVYAGVAVWGIAFGGAPTLLMKYLSERAGKQIDIAQSAYVTCFNGSVAVGAFIGGVILDCAGSPSLPLIAMLLSGALLILFVCYLNSPHSKTTVD